MGEICVYEVRLNVRLIGRRWEHELRLTYTRRLDCLVHYDMLKEEALSTDKHEHCEKDERNIENLTMFKR